MYNIDDTYNIRSMGHSTKEASGSCTPSWSEEATRKWWPAEGWTMIFQLISIVYSNNTKFIIYSLEKSGKHDGKLLAKSCCYEKRYYIHGSSMEGAALFFNEVTHVNTSMFFLNICWGICIYLQKIHKQYIKCKVREIFNK